MNQAEYEHMMKVYSYISSSLPNSPEREKRLAEIGEEDSSKLWDFYVGLCSGRIKKPEIINKESEVSTMNKEKRITSYKDFKDALTRTNCYKMLCEFERQNPMTAREYKRQLEEEKKKRSEILAIPNTRARHKAIYENMALFGR